MKKVIYEFNGEICLMTPNESLLEFLSIEEIANKDVPEGIAYWVIDSDDVRSISLRFITLDKSITPSGYGGALYEFSEEQIKKIKVL